MQRPELLPAAPAALLIVVTAFARDERVLPAVALRAFPHLQRSGGVLRVWSFGCADGEELLSLNLERPPDLFSEGGRGPSPIKRCSDELEVGNNAGAVVRFAVCRPPVVSPDTAT